MQVVQDDWQFHIMSVAIFLIIWSSYGYLILQVKILELIKMRSLIMLTIVLTIEPRMGNMF